MSYIFCDACRAGFHSNVLSCPDCGAPARRVTWRRTRFTEAAPTRSPREDIELDVRNALYEARSGTVEKLSHV